VVPFLKVVNDTAVAVNQGGKRKGAVCAYLETWHLDIEEFLELRKNTGDDRRRTHDMNTANWIPDLFMKRVMENGEWTLFSPSDVPRPARQVRPAFEEAYTALRAKAAAASSSCSRSIRPCAVAQDALDAVRDRASLDHLQGPLQPALAAAARGRGAQLQPVHRDHAQHQRHRDRRVQPGLGEPGRAHEGRRRLDHAKLKRTVRTAMRMLDNVIDINYYAVDKARNSNLRTARWAWASWASRTPARLRMPYASEEAVEFADRSMEAVCYYAYWASTELAEERGRYATSRARCGTAASCRRTRSSCWPRSAAATSRSTAATLDWEALRAAHRPARHAQLQLHGHRAHRDHLQHHRRVASIEPTYQNLYVKSNLSGEFTVVNEYLVRDLKKLGPVGRGDGRRPQVLRRQPAAIDRIPAELRSLYATAFEVDTRWLVEARRAARSGSTRRSR
jgi:ribonucleoside-diphosphate reductase alpha chain